MIKFRADSSSIKIMRLECEKETKSSIWINGSRRSKISSWDNYFNSFDDAVKWKIEKMKTRINDSKKQTEYYQEALDNFLKYVEERKCQ